MDLNKIEKVCVGFAEFILQFPGLYVTHGDQGTKNRYRLNFPVGRDVSLEELMEKFKESITVKVGYKCPNCGTSLSSSRGEIAMTKPQFNKYGSKDWDELHECNKCESLFIIHNGT